MPKRCRRCHKRLQTPSPEPPLLNFFPREAQVTGSGTWEVPLNVTHLRVRAWGGGSGASSLKALAVSNGGSGGLVEVELVVKPEQEIVYDVGKGGHGANFVDSKPHPGQETSVTFLPTDKTPLVVIIASGGHVESSAGGTIFPQKAQTIIQRKVQIGRGGKGGEGGQLGLPGKNGADGGLIFEW
jgi:hypothetical protein